MLLNPETVGASLQKKFSQERGLTMEHIDVINGYQDARKKIVEIDASLRGPVSNLVQRVIQSIDTEIENELKALLLDSEMENLVKEVSK